MKRTIIATAALLLLLSSTTYAFHPPRRHRPRIISGPELGWCTGSHRHEWVWVERYSRWECAQPVVYFEYEWSSPGYRWCPGCGRGWHDGSEYCRRHDWERPRWGGWHDREWPPEHEHGHGRD